MDIHFQFKAEIKFQLEKTSQDFFHLISIISILIYTNIHWAHVMILYAYITQSLVCFPFAIKD